MTIKVTKKELKIAMDEQMKSLNEQLEELLNEEIGTYKYSEYIDFLKGLTNVNEKYLLWTKYCYKNIFEECGFCVSFSFLRKIKFKILTKNFKCKKYKRILR